VSSQGKLLGRDAFFDLLRDHGLLIHKRKKRKPRTTFSGLWMRRYPNLAKGLCSDGGRPPFEHRNAHAGTGSFADRSLAPLLEKLYSQQRTDQKEATDLCHAGVYATA